jgi:hypothetical protein
VLYGGALPEDRLARHEGGDQTFDGSMSSVISVGRARK